MEDLFSEFSEGEIAEWEAPNRSASPTPGVARRPTSPTPPPPSGPPSYAERTVYKTLTDIRHVLQVYDDDYRDEMSEYPKPSLCEVVEVAYYASTGAFEALLAPLSLLTFDTELIDFLREKFPLPPNGVERIVSILYTLRKPSEQVPHSMQGPVLDLISKLLVSGCGDALLLVDTLSHLSLAVSNLLALLSPSALTHAFLEGITSSSLLGAHVLHDACVQCSPEMLAALRAASFESIVSMLRELVPCECDVVSVTVAIRSILQRTKERDLASEETRILDAVLPLLPLVSCPLSDPKAVEKPVNDCTSLLWRLSSTVVPTMCVEDAKDLKDMSGTQRALKVMSGLPFLAVCAAVASHSPEGALACFAPSVGSNRLEGHTDAVALALVPHFRTGHFRNDPILHEDLLNYVCRCSSIEGGICTAFLVGVMICDACVANREARDYDDVTSRPVPLVEDYRWPSAIPGTQKSAPDGGLPYLPLAITEHTPAAMVPHTQFPFPLLSAACGVLAEDTECLTKGEKAWTDYLSEHAASAILILYSTVLRNPVCVRRLSFAYTMSAVGCEDGRLRSGVLGRITPGLCRSLVSGAMLAFSALSATETVGMATTMAHHAHGSNLHPGFLIALAAQDAKDNWMEPVPTFPWLTPALVFVMASELRILQRLSAPTGVTRDLYVAPTAGKAMILALSGDTVTEGSTVTRSWREGKDLRRFQCPATDRDVYGTLAIGPEDIGPFAPLSFAFLYLQLRMDFSKVMRGAVVGDTQRTSFSIRRQVISATKEARHLISFVSVLLILYGRAGLKTAFCPAPKLAKDTMEEQFKRRADFCRKMEGVDEDEVRVFENDLKLISDHLRLSKSNKSKNERYHLYFYSAYRFPFVHIEPFASAEELRTAYKDQEDVDEETVAARTTLDEDVLKLSPYLGENVRVGILTPSSRAHWAKLLVRSNDVIGVLEDDLPKSCRVCLSRQAEEHPVPRTLPHAYHLAALSLAVHCLDEREDMEVTSYIDMAAYLSGCGAEAAAVAVALTLLVARAL